MFVWAALADDWGPPPQDEVCGRVTTACMIMSTHPDENSSTLDKPRVIRSQRKAWSQGDYAGRNKKPVQNSFNMTHTAAENALRAVNARRVHCSPSYFMRTQLVSPRCSYVRKLVHQFYNTVLNVSLCVSDAMFYT